MSKRTATKVKKAEALIAEARLRKLREKDMVDITLDLDTDTSIDPTMNMSAEEAKAFLNPKTGTDIVPWEEDENNPDFVPAGLAGGGRKVMLIRDHILEYPELYLEVFIAGTSYEERAFAEMFARARCTRAKSLDVADLCVFTGGVDVDPILYGETPHPKTHISPARDQADIETYKFCLEHGIPMLGVCRGMQFGHAMNKGKIFQHIDNHTGDHSMFDLTTKKHLDCVSSVHHQACRPNRDNGMKIIATSAKSRERWINGKEKHKGPNVDIEALWYRDACFFGVQGHPEYKGYNHFTVWVLDKLNEYVMLNPDVDWVDGARRVRPDILAQRKLGWGETILVNTNEGAE